MKELEEALEWVKEEIDFLEKVKSKKEKTQTGEEKNGGESGSTDSTAHF